MQIVPNQENSGLLERESIPYQRRLSGSARQAESGTESLQGILEVLRRRKKLIALTIGASLALGILVCLMMTPKFESTATIEISPEDNSPLGAGSAAASSDPDAVKAEVETDAKILEDDTLALAVIQKLNLTSQPYYQVKPGPLDILRGSPLRKEQGLPLDQAPLTRAALLKRFAKSLKIESVGDTRLIAVTFRNPDPKIAALGANTLVHAFIEDSLDRHDRSVGEASFWLSKQLNDLKGKVEDSQKRLADYERKTGLGGIELGQSSGGGGVAPQTRNVTLDKLSALNDQLTTAQANRISAEAVYMLVRTQDPEVVLGFGNLGISSGAAGATIGTGSLQLLQQLRQQEVGLKAQYANLATKYGENNPQLQEVKSQLDSVQQSAQHEMANITKRAQNTYLIAQRDEDSIKKEFTEQQSAANKLNDDTVQLQVLAQEALSNRTLYENVFSRLQEATIAAGVKATRVGIVDAARVAAKPAQPNIPLYLLAALAFGIFAGLTVAFVKENLDTTVQNPRDVELFTDLPVLAHIPTTAQPEGHQLALLNSETSNLSDAFSILKTAVLQQGKAGKSKIILVTSPLTGDGKTSITYNLALSFARQGARVLIIDGDLRKSAIHVLCGCDNDFGIRDLAKGSFDLRDAVVPATGIPNLSLLPAGNQPGWPDEIFATNEFHVFLEEAKQEYDRIFIDTPPMLVVADASILSSYADALLLVVRLGHITKNALPHFSTAVERTGRPVLGCVINGVDTKSSEYMLTYYGQTGKKEPALYANSAG
jgi:succinoglycan biosynthesis transport protein ExoP